MRIDRLLSWITISAAMLMLTGCGGNDSQSHPNDPQLPNVVNIRYSGDAAGGNTTLTIDNYAAMNVSEEDIGVNWDAYETIWQWSNPTVQNVIGTDIRNYTGVLQLTTDGDEAFVLNPEIMTEYIDDLRLDWRRDIDTATVAFSGDGADTDTRVTSTNGTLITHDHDALTDALTVRLGPAAYPRTYALQFTGSGWVETGADTIVDGDYPASATLTSVGTHGEFGFQIDLDNDGNADIVTLFKHPLDMTESGDDAGESVTFEVQDTHWAWNHPDIVKEADTGDAAGNTVMKILNSNSLTTTLTNIRLDYNDKSSGTGRWYWNRPDTFGANSTDHPRAHVFLEDSLTVTGGIAELDALGNLDITFPTYTGINPAMTEYAKGICLEWVQTQAYQAGPDGLAGTTDDIPAQGTFRWAISGRPLDSPPAQYPNAAFTVTYAAAGDGQGQPTGLDIDLDNDGYLDIGIDFTGGGAGTGLVESGSIAFDIDPLSDYPPTQYISAQILINTGSELGIDLDSDDRIDVAWNFEAPLTNASTITFDILTHADTPPREYDAAIIDPLSDENDLRIDLNHDGTDNIRFSFDPATTQPEIIGYLIFDIDPRIAPMMYPDAEIKAASDQTRLLLDLDFNISDNRADMMFTFSQPLENDSSIRFDIDVPAPLKAGIGDQWL